MGNAQRLDLPVQPFCDALKFRCHDGGVELHDFQGVRLVLQEPHMAQLVDLIVGDHLHTENAGEIADIGLAGSHAGNAAAGKGDLGGGRELVDHIRPSRLVAQGKDVRERDVVALEFVDAIGVVPDDGKVRGSGLQVGKAADGLVGINDTVGVGIFGNRPYELDLRVLHQLLHHVHIRAFGSHGDGNQLRAEELADLEMPVISGGGAEKFHLFLPAPWLGAVEQAVGVGTGHHVEHHIQGSRAADEHLIRLAAQHIRPVPPGTGNTRQFAVIPGVHAVVEAVLRGLQYSQQAADHVQLLRGGLAPGHIQIQPLRLAGFVGRQHTAVFTFQFFPGHAGIGSHINHPFGILTSFTCILYVRSPKNATSDWAKIHFSSQKSRNL